MGGKASTSGDVYSFGILLLEIIIAKKPTDGVFQEGLSINKFISEVHESKILDIADPRLFKDNEFFRKAAVLIILLVKIAAARTKTTLPSEVTSAWLLW